VERITTNVRAFGFLTDSPRYPPPNAKWPEVVCAPARVGALTCGTSALEIAEAGVPRRALDQVNRLGHARLEKVDRSRVGALLRAEHLRVMKRGADSGISGKELRACALCLGAWVEVLLFRPQNIMIKPNQTVVCGMWNAGACMERAHYGSPTARGTWLMEDAWQKVGTRMQTRAAPLGPSRGLPTSTHTRTRAPGRKPSGGARIDSIWLRYLPQKRQRASDGGWGTQKEKRRLRR